MKLQNSVTSINSDRHRKEDVKQSRESVDQRTSDVALKARNTDFPLDHILPVFKLGKKESNFIPTLKIKSHDK